MMSGPASEALVVQRSGRRPVRAIVQHLTSRIVVLAVLVGILLLVRTAPVPWSRDGDAAEQGAAALAIGAPAPATGPGVGDGRTVGGILAAVDAGIGRGVGDLVRLSGGRPDGREMHLELEVDVPEGAAALDELLDALTDAGIERLIPRRMVPTPSGLRASVTGRARLSVDPLVTPDPGGGPLAVLVAQQVERSQVELRALEVTSDREPQVRLEVDGAPERIAAFVLAIEEQYSAPVRVSAVEVRVIGDDRRRLLLAFRPRSASSE